MIPSSGCPPWPPDHPRTPSRTGIPTPPRGARPRLAWRRASELFCEQVLQAGVVEHGVGQEALELRVLVLQHLEAARFGDLQAAILGLPGVERRRADPMPAADVDGGPARLLLPQDRDDLLVREPRSLHGPVLPGCRTLPSPGGENGGQVNRRSLQRSEEHTSELQSRQYLVCRL